MPRGTYRERSSASSASVEECRTVTRAFKQIRSGPVDAARAAVDRLWPDRPARITELGGGITNHDFKVDVGDGVFVLRMGGAKTELLGIDREVEYEAGRRAFEVGIGPEVVAFVPEEGWLVARFIEGRPITPAEMRSPDRKSTRLNSSHRCISYAVF